MQPARKPKIVSLDLSQVTVTTDEILADLRYGAE
jgi:hypothetical protein